MCYYSTRCIPCYKFLHFIYSKFNPLFRDTIIITLIFHIRFLERIAPLFGYNVKVSAVYPHFRVWKVKRTISTLLSKSTYKNKKKKNENNIYIISGSCLREKTCTHEESHSQDFQPANAWAVYSKTRAKDADRRADRSLTVASPLPARNTGPPIPLTAVASSANHKPPPLRTSLFEHHFRVVPKIAPAAKSTIHRARFYTGVYHGLYRLDYPRCWRIVGVTDSKDLVDYTPHALESDGTTRNNCVMQRMVNWNAIDCFAIISIYTYRSSLCSYPC